MLTAVMPIGPEFASPDTFFPLGLEKIYDVIYVAAAQAYKRHDILFDALAQTAALRPGALRLRLWRTRRRTAGARGANSASLSISSARPAWTSPKSTG